MITKRQLRRQKGPQHSTKGKPGYSIVSYCPKCFTEGRMDSDPKNRAQPRPRKVGEIGRYTRCTFGDTWELVR